MPGLPEINLLTSEHQSPLRQLQHVRVRTKNDSRTLARPGVAYRLPRHHIHASPSRSTRPAGNASRRLVPPLGVEPRFPVPETGALSIELRGPLDWKGSDSQLEANKVEPDFPI